MSTALHLRQLIICQLAANVSQSRIQDVSITLPNDLLACNIHCGIACHITFSLQQRHYLWHCTGQSTKDM